jgi:hypothetical protein
VPRQNRVTPFGELIATPARGTLMGNRGCLHDAAGRIRRAFVGRRWIICVLQFKGRRRPLMTPGHYTELFFLDEATALAAGHRPCVECQRDRYRLFLEHWVAGRPVPARQPPLVDTVDEVLHAERLHGRRDRAAYVETPARLPSGVIVADGDQACLVHSGALLPWTPVGYEAPRPTTNAALRVLTPRSIVQAIAHGYPVEMHPSASR